MAKDTETNTNAGQLEPGESNQRAVRDGVKHGAQRDAGNTAPAKSDVAPPVNTGENIATSAAVVPAARRPARAKMPGAPAKTTKRAR